jgi:hypothetical protein
MLLDNGDTVWIGYSEINLPKLLNLNLVPKI